MSDSSQSGARRVAPGRLLICGRCHGLRGPVPDRDDGAEQLCWCAPLELRRAQPRWADHNTYAELCYCCGLELLPSGSRWSVWFCGPCKVQVMRFNAAARRCLLPIGRHSIMNGFGLAGSAGQSEIEQFVADIQTLAASQDALLHHAREVVITGNLAAIGWPAGEHLPLDTYLHEIGRTGLTREQAFDRLVDWVRSQ